MTTAKAAQRSCGLLSKQQRLAPGGMRPAFVARILGCRRILDQPSGHLNRRMEGSVNSCRGRLVCTAATSTSETVTQESKSRLPQEPAAPRRYALRLRCNIDVATRVHFSWCSKVAGVAKEGTQLAGGPLTGRESSQGSSPLGRST